MPTSQPSQQQQAANKDRIVDVWEDNLSDEFENIQNIVEDYPYIAMDTEFPGVVCKPPGDTRQLEAKDKYTMIKYNVNMLKLIQVGLTFFNKDGKRPKGKCTWQFNFKFSLQNEMYAQESIELLKNAGIQFNRLEQNGIDPQEFACRLMTSGAVLLTEVHWLSYHSVYDFGYMMKLMIGQDLPEDLETFYKNLKTYFCNVYDLKNMALQHEATIQFGQKGGLEDLATFLDVERVGSAHQAGSDSLLTGDTFFAMTKKYFENDENGNLENSRNDLYGIGDPMKNICGEVPQTEDNRQRLKSISTN